MEGLWRSATLRLWDGLLLAQVSPFGPVAGGNGNGQPPPGPSMDLPIRLGVFVIVLLSAFWIWYFLIFESLLKKKSKSLWPKTVYGRVSAGFFTTVGVVGLWLFWDKLMIDKLVPGINVKMSFVTDWAVRATLALLIVLTDLYFWFYHRSPARAE